MYYLESIRQNWQTLAQLNLAFQFHQLTTCASIFASKRPLLEMLVEACLGKEFVKMWTVNGYIVWWPLEGLGDRNGAESNYGFRGKMSIGHCLCLPKNCRKSWICLKWRFTLCKSPFESFFWLHNVKSLNFSRFLSPKCRLCSEAYPPETNSSPLKINGWKMKLPSGMSYFQGLC